MTPISKTVGAIRIVPGIAIPHPVGDPSLSLVKEAEVRREIIEKALDLLQKAIG